MVTRITVTALVTRLLDKLQWEPFLLRLIKNWLVMAYKIQNMLLENQHSRFYTSRDTSTRRGQHLRQQHTNKDLYRYSLVPRSTREWHALSDSMTSAATLDDSKVGLTKLLTTLIVTAHHWAVHTTKCTLLKPAVYMFGFVFVYICSLEQSQLHLKESDSIMEEHTLYTFSKHTLE